jgi:hypothetical protein
VLVAALAAGTLVALAASCGGVDEAERDRAVAAAAQAFEQTRDQDVDFTDGPCIADPLASMPNWVVDVAHDPREDVDDDPANQCASYRSGDADHFVELDRDGNLIRAK